MPAIHYVVTVCGRLEESANCECTEAASCRRTMESHSTVGQSQPRLLASVADHSTPEQPVVVLSTESDYAVQLNGCESAASVCETESTAENSECENAAHSVDSALLNNEQSSSSDVTDTAKRVVVNSLEQTPDSSDVHRYPADHSRDNLGLSGISDPELPLCNDLELSLDPGGSGDVWSVKTGSECAVSEKEGVCDNGASTWTESFMGHADVDSHGDCVEVTSQSLSVVDSVCGGESDSMPCSATVNTGVSGVRSILTASLSEVSAPAEETVTHIGSTHIHVTDELSIINDVVQPVESPVKIGEFLILCSILSRWVLAVESSYVIRSYS